MKGDFSRLRLAGTKHYRHVLTQQGRVQLDADANEQRAIDDHLERAEAFDIVGQSGAPIHNAGFAIGLRSDGASLTIGSGRYYIDGLLCENDVAVDYTGQDFLYDPSHQISAMLADLRNGTAQAVQVWLEAWQRFVVPIDDPDIKEIALGEADTTVRIQTAWRVIAQVVPAAIDTATIAMHLDVLNQALGGLRLATNQPTLAPLQTNVAAALSNVNAQPVLTQDSSIALADSLRLVQTNLVSSLASVSLQGSAGVQVAQSALALNTLISALPATDCCKVMRSQVTRVSAPGKLSAQVKGSSDQGPCLPSPNAAYRGLENQLYRVEIHRGGDATTATFKWSRDNGSVLTKIDGISGSTVTVDSLGLDANLGFAPGQWVEISDDSNEFGIPPSQPGTLVGILGTDPTHLQITLSGNAPNVDTASGHAKMRRWDHTTGTSQGIPLSAGTWIDLENGVQVMFSADGLYAAGDFWLIPARTAIGDIEWPPAESDGQLAQPSLKVSAYRTPLACIHFENRQLLVEDCRQIFRPLVEITPPAIPTAMHVEAISWANDDVITWDQLIASGLTITFDQAPNFPLTGANFIVTLELPVWKSTGFSLVDFAPDIALAAAAAVQPAAAAVSPPIATTLADVTLARPVVSPAISAEVLNTVATPAAAPAAPPAPSATPAAAAPPIATQALRVETVSPAITAALQQAASPVAANVIAAQPALNVGAPTAQTPKPDTIAAIDPQLIDTAFSLGNQISYARVPYILDGDFTGLGTTAVKWIVQSAVNSYMSSLLQNAVTMAARNVYPRLRISLKGRAIGAVVNSATVYLDGQCFTYIATRNKVAYLNLSLPSGNSEKASDFESWFYVAPPPQIQFAVAPNNVTVRSGASIQEVQGTVTLNYAAVQNMEVNFSYPDNYRGMIAFAESAVTMGAGTTSQTVQISVLGGIPGSPTNIPLTATLTNSGGGQSIATTTLTVTGVVG